MAPERILIVEDDPVIRDLMTDVLQGSGYEVSSAVNGADAIRPLVTYLPDLLISDLEMPITDGWTLLKFIRRTRLNVRILIVSGRRVDRRELDQIGADGFLDKPFDLDDLVQKVDELSARCTRPSENVGPSADETEVASAPQSIGGPVRPVESGEARRPTRIRRRHDSPDRRGGDRWQTVVFRKGRDIAPTD
jgi:DNA-binding response OmpR family regulator